MASCKNNRILKSVGQYRSAPQHVVFLAMVMSLFCVNADKSQEDNSGKGTSKKRSDKQSGKRPDSKSADLKSQTGKKPSGKKTDKADVPERKDEKAVKTGRKDDHSTKKGRGDQNLKKQRLKKPTQASLWAKTAQEMWVTKLLSYHHHLTKHHPWFHWVLAPKGI